MSWLDKLFFFVCKQKWGFKQIFFSVFWVILIGFIGSVILYKAGVNNVYIWPIPLYISMGYFYLCFITMQIRFHYYIGVDGKLQKRIFVKKTEVYNEFRQAAKKHGWKVKNAIGTADMGFTVKGTEQGVDFEIEMLDTMSSNSGAVGAYAVYIKTQKGENFEILPNDVSKNKEISSPKVKSKLIGDNKDNLVWLMGNNKYITKISFYNGLMAALIFDNISMAQNVKEVVSKLVQISKTYKNY